MEYNSKIQFSLGYNFDTELIDLIAEQNSKYKDHRIVNEFFAALPNSPLLSTRPNNRIRSLTWKEFSLQVKKMGENKINFNYLLNAKTKINEIDVSKITDFIKRIYDIGIIHLIVYSPEICNLIKSINNKFFITISSVYNIRTEGQIDEAFNSGADFIYLDSIFMNRNFKLLRKLQYHSKIPLKLYSNISCLSQCINKDLHYSVLSNQDKDFQIKMNDKLFYLCSLEKLKNPVKWIQMQWIRPEDIEIYHQEGFNHFKLTDRLASTQTLISIAEHYLKGFSPHNLFQLIERDGSKFKDFITFKKGNQNPMYINNSKIPTDFIEHFRCGDCDSTDIYCPFCNQIASNAINIDNDYQHEINNLYQEDYNIIQANFFHKMNI